MFLFYKFDAIYIFMKYYDTYLHKDEKHNKYLRTLVQYHKWLVKGGLWAPIHLFPATLLI